MNPTTNTLPQGRILDAADMTRPAPDAPPSRRRLGAMLLDRLKISDDDLAKALGFQKDYGSRLGAILVRLGAVSEDDVLAALAAQLGMEILAADQIPSDPEVLLAEPRKLGMRPTWCIDQDTLLWRDEQGRLRCLARDPLFASVREILDQAYTSEPVLWCLARSQVIDAAVSTLRDRASENADGPSAGTSSQLRELAEEAPTVELVSNILAQAVGERASDVHVEPRKTQFDIRFRIDGVLHTRFTLPRSRFDAVASRIKLVAGLDIAERRLPQDGRIGLRIAGQELDIRVSSLPGMYGESIVMRLLFKEQQELALDKIGMALDHRAAFGRIAHEPHGIILVTGPTGSGKSTTLKAVLDDIRDNKKKIITVEDPVEYHIAGVTQVQVKTDIGYNFAKALRSILRQDPDIIMIGEIRDIETAQIAVQASLTGHMVFSTLHTNDSLTAFTRLVDMGVEPFLVSSAVRAVLAQRLARRLCPRCCEVYSPPSAVEAKMQVLESRIPGIAPGEARWSKAVGCDACQKTGYKGRLGIYELVLMSDELSEAIAGRAHMSQIVEIARKDGYRDLVEDGLLKARRGLTSIEEVVRVAGHTDILESLAPNG